jgi:Ca-activated chloride channel homolog
MKPCRGLVWLGLMLLVVSGARGAGLVVVNEIDRTWPPDGPPRILPPPRPGPVPIPRPRPFAPLELTRHETAVRITDQLARVTIEQEFHNPNDRRIEGRFMFPLPRGAQLSRFTLKINGQAVEAELLDAAKARAIYEDIVRRAQDPALLEYAGGEVYQVRVFPVEPRQRRQVSISYEQWLPMDAGLVEFRLPLGAARFSARPIPSLEVRIDLETRKPLKSIYSPTHATEVRRTGDRQARLHYHGTRGSPESDLQLFFSQDQEPVGVQLMAYRSGDEDGAFLLLLSPGVEADRGRIVPKDVVFVLDTSGSMAGGKLDQARKALLFCVENLNAEDRFDVLRFSSDTEWLFQELTAVRDHTRTQAREFIDRLKPLGGTAIDAALQQALQRRPSPEGRPFVIIFLTDGRPTVGTVDENQILSGVQAANAVGTRIFSFGIGHDVNTHLLDKLTESTRASSQYVLPEEDLELKVSSFFARIRDPVLINPVLEWGPGVRVRQLHPARLPDLFSGEQLLVTGRFEAGGETTVVLRGEANGQPLAFNHPLHFPAQAKEHAFIPRLWATRRVGFLLDEIRLRGEQAELRDEVIDLARRHGIVTPFTAWLIVEDEERRGVPDNLQSLPGLQRDRGARELTARQWQEGQVARFGLAPVSRARGDAALRSAEVPATAIESGQVEAARSVAGGTYSPPSQGAGRLPRPGVAESATATAVEVGQLSQYAGGRNFFWTGERWLDAAAQSHPAATVRQVTFGSDDYFTLARRHPEAQAWLALGPQVEFLLGDTRYQIVP